MLIRNATDSDKEQLRVLFKECFGNMAENNGALSWINGRYKVAEIDNRIVAVNLGKRANLISDIGGVISGVEMSTVSEEEFKYLSCVVYHETNSEPYEGKLAMANMIINRYYNDCDGIFPHSISGIIFQEGQFMVSDPEFAQNWKDTVTIYEKGGFTTENHLLCLRAIYDALNGKNNIGTRIITSVYITEKNKGHRNAIRIQNNMFWDREDIPW